MRRFSSLCPSPLLTSARFPTQGISSIALIVIISQLYTVCKEVKFLQNIQSEWLPKLNVSSATASALTSASTSAASNSQQQQLQQTRFIQSRNIENLRKDFDLLIIELWSTRTTLILGVVFVLAYIFSWVWMTYQLELTLCVSLKSVLLLVVFAAVDIAASTGFILVRVIMVSVRVSLNHRVNEERMI